MKITRTAVRLMLLPLVLFPGNVFGQGNYTLYHMKTIPQRIYTNPARQSDAKSFVALPVISSVYLNMSNSAFSLNSILSAVETNPTTNSSFLNVKKIGDIFQESNFIGINNSFDLLSMGFQIKKKNYLYFTSSFNSAVRITYPGDFVDLITQGNGGSNLNRTFDLAFGVDMLQYMDFGIGFNRKFLDNKLTVGARYRLIKGINVMNTERNKITFHTDPETFKLTVQSDIRLNFASSLATVDSLSELRKIDSLGRSGYLSGANTGSAIDFGLEFRPNEKWTISASLNNLGKINWDNSAFAYSSKFPNATYTFDGIYVEDIFADSTNFEQALQRLGDTLEERFQLEDRKSNFSSNLFTEFYIGGQYNLKQDHNVGVLFNGSFYQKKLYPAFTLSYNSKLTNVFALSASYTARSNSYTNLGVGVSVNLGSFQFYAVSDNIGGVLAPRHVKNVNLRTGFNLTMQRKDPNKKAANKTKKEDKKKKKEEEKVKKKKPVEN